MGRRSLLTLGSLGAVAVIGGAGVGLRLLSSEPEAVPNATPPPTTRPSTVPTPSTSMAQESGAMGAAMPVDRDEAYAQYGRPLDDAGAGVHDLQPAAPSSAMPDPAMAEPAAGAEPTVAEASPSTPDPVAAPAAPTPGVWHGVPVDPTPEQVAHLLNRVTFGSSPADRAAMATGGIGAWLDRQFDPGNLPDPDGDAVRAAFPLAFADVSTVISSIEKYHHRAAQQTGFGTMGLQILSSRQLLEVLADLFTNLLHVTTPADPSWGSGPDYQSQVIRRNVTGTFRDMLLASARHPAMLRFLDNASSTGTSVNENYGRELLELHTVGLGAGFTEADVRASAEILTGRSVNSDEQFVYRPERHKVGPITVLGFSDANADAATGLEAGDRYLSYLATHPATAANVARKIAVRFVSDRPSPELVDRLAQVYLASDTAILPVVRAVINDPDFWNSLGHKIRRPLEDLVGTARALELKTTGDLAAEVEAAYWAAAVSGHAPLSWTPPNGYPDVAAAWLSAGGMVTSWNMHRRLVYGHLGGLKRTATVKETHAPTGSATYREWIGGMSMDLLGLWANEATVLAICTGLAVGPGQIVGSSMDWQAPDVAALLFDSPQFQLR